MRIGQQVQVPRWEDMMALADAFGISLVHWFSEEDRPLALDVDGMIRVLEDDLVRAYFGDQAPSMSDRHLVAWMMRLARGDISNVMGRRRGWRGKAAFKSRCCRGDQRRIR